MRTELKRSERATGLQILLVVVLGCAGQDQSGPPVLRSDSAGVEVVESVRPAWEKGVAWHIDPDPTVSIGRIEGEEPYLFGDVIGAARFEDGVVVVGDGLARELRVFDSTGVYLRTLGGPGEGPGEFWTLTRLWRCEGDNLCALDFRQRVIQVWTRTGENIRTVPALEPNRDPPRRAYLMEPSPESEGFLSIGWGTDGLEGGEQGEIFRTVAPAWLIDKDGGLILELGEYVSAVRYLSLAENGGGTIAPHPFGSAASFALSQDHIFVGTGEVFEISVFDREGVLVRLLRGPTEDLAISETMIEDYRRADLTEEEDEDRWYWERAGSPTLETVPAFTEIKVDFDGNVWVKRFTPPGQSENRWAVFARSGEFLGHIHLPTGFTLTDLSPNQITGIVTDDLGVDRVEVYAVEKR